MSIDLKTAGLILLGATHISLALFVLAHNPRAKVNKLFALSVFTLVGWILSISLGLSSEDVRQTIVLGRLGFAFASAIPFTLLWMFEAFSDPLVTFSKRSVFISGIFCALFMFFSFSPWIVAGVKVGTPRSNFIYGPIHPFFGVYFLLGFGLALYTLWKKILDASGIKKLQLRYLLLGVLLGGAGGMTTNLIIPLVWKTSRFSILGPYFTLLLVSFSAHAIIRYRLMDIRVFIKKSIVYVCAIGIAALVFMGFAAFLNAITGYQQESIPLGAAVAIAVMVAIFFQPFKGWIQNLFNQYLYRRTYDYQRTVREASRRLSTILELEPLLGSLVEGIERTLKVEMVAVYLRARPQREFTPKVFHRANEWEESSAVPPLASSSPLAAFLEREKRTLIRDEVREDLPDPRLAAAIGELEALGGELAFPVFQDQTVSGIVIVGPKLSGDPYFTEDIDLLSTLVSQAGIAIKNAQLYGEIVLANEFIQNILANMESGVIAIDAEGKVTLFNPAAERMIGQGSEPLRVGSSAALPPAIAQTLAATLEDGSPRLHIESIIPDPSGRLAPVVLNTSPLTDDDGQVLGAVVVFSDLTKLKELEGEKRRSERLAAWSALAAGIAHEIKNPLVAIKTFAELLPERYTDVDFRENFSNVAIKEIERIDALVGRLRGLGAPSVQTFHLLDLRQPIDETLALLAGQLEQKRISVTKEYDEGLPPVSADPAQLKQLFLNLFMNSFDAMEPGGRLNIRLTTRSGYGQDTVHVEVGDTGKGIPEEMIEKVFNPFVSTKHKGLGLGLAICRGIADSHRATIRAENNRDRRGATLIVEFPVAGEVAAAVHS